MLLQVPGFERNDMQSTGRRGRERSGVGRGHRKYYQKNHKAIYVALKKRFSVRLNSLMPCRAKEA